jgi:exodeoxyribonuclease X
MNYLILDTETSSLYDPEIVELGFITTDDKFNTTLITDDLCSTKNPISFSAMMVHDITNEMVVNKPSVLDSNTYKLLITKSTTDHLLVGHNMTYDINALKNNGINLSYQVIDTYKVSHRLYDSDESVENLKLKYLAYRFDFYKDAKVELLTSGNSSKSAHSVVFDCMLTKYLLQYLVNNSNLTIDEMITISNEPILYSTINYGKYKGQRYEEIYKNDPKYYEWLINNSLEKLIDSGATQDEIRSDPGLYTLMYYKNKSENR